MTDVHRIEQAFDRFEAALTSFEVLLKLVNQQGQQLQRLASETEVLRGDRARIVNELDLVRSKASELITTHKTAVVKIDAAMTSIRTVLHSNSGS